MTRLALLLLLTGQFMGKRPVMWFETCEVKIVRQHSTDCDEERLRELMNYYPGQCEFDAGTQRVCRFEIHCFVDGGWTPCID